MLPDVSPVPGEFPSSPGTTYKPFQQVGIQFLTTHAAALLGDEPGCGKTVQTLGMLNALPAIRATLVVCPATMKLPWKREAATWLCPALATEIGVVDGTWTSAQLRAFLSPPAGVRRLAICNYELLPRHCTVLRFASLARHPIETYQFLAGLVIDQVVCDEGHLLNNPTTQRTKAVQGIATARRLLLTGTPIDNHLDGLWSLLHILDPLAWPTLAQFQARYHADNPGSLQALGQTLRATLLLRRTKADVLPDLPRKQRQVIELPLTTARGLVANEWSAYRAYLQRKADLATAVAQARVHTTEATYRDTIRELKRGITAQWRELARLRHATALAKLPYVIQHMQMLLNSTTEKVLVFAHHRDVLASLVAALPQGTATALLGGMTASAREASIDRFQQDPTCRVCIGSIRAAGLGVTLTAASLVLFAELDWKPSALLQCEDRANRIGQHHPVTVHYLVLDASLDATMATTFITKQAVSDATLLAA